MSGSLMARHVLSRVRSLPALPRIWQELNGALHDDSSTHDQIVQLIAQDPALTAGTLKLANSPFYGVSGRVVSLRDAVQILGVQTVAAASLTALVSSRFPSPVCEGYDMEGRWRHALGTAMCAEMLANMRGLDPHSAYTLGLVHDLGSLALAVEFGPEFSATIAWAEANDLPLVEAERARLGMDHAQIGGLIATHWRLSPDITHAIESHHDVPSGHEVTLVDVLHLADSIVHALDLEGRHSDMVPPLSVSAWGRMDLQPEEMQSLFVSVEQQLGSVRHSLCEP